MTACAAGLAGLEVVSINEPAIDGQDGESNLAVLSELIIDGGSALIGVEWIGADECVCDFEFVFYFEVGNCFTGRIAI